VPKEFKTSMQRPSPAGQSGQLRSHREAAVASRDDGHATGLLTQAEARQDHARKWNLIFAAATACRAGALMNITRAWAAARSFWVGEWL
jgi:hypothetical protein